MAIGKVMAGILVVGLFAGNAGAADLADVLGVAHVDGKYSFTKEDFLDEGADLILTTGSRTINLYLCDSAAQKYSFNAEWPKFDSLIELAQTPYFKSAFAKPFHTYVLTTYSVGRPHDYWTGGITDGEKADETRQFYDLTKYLLTNYRGSGKTFVLQHWEGDWALRDATVDGRKTTYDAQVDPSQTAIDGMIQWINARQAGIAKARKEIGDSDVRVYGATEANRVIDQMNGRPGVVNKVLPNTTVDLVAYSSYESDDSPAALNKAVDFLAAHLPASAAFGRNAHSVYLGEWGGDETRIGDSAMNRRIDTVLDVAQSRGLFAAIFWQAYSNELKSDQIAVPVKSLDEVKGFWLVKPNGLPSLAWLRLREALVTSNPATASSAAIKSGLTEIYRDDFNHNADSDIGPGWHHTSHYGPLEVQTADSRLQLKLPEGHTKTWGSATLILSKVIGRGLKPGEYFEFSERRLNGTGALGVELFDSDQLRQSGLWDEGPSALDAWTGDKVAGWVPFSTGTLQGNYDRTSAVDDGNLRRSCTAALSEFQNDPNVRDMLKDAAGYLVIPETVVYDKGTAIRGEAYDGGNVVGVAKVSQEKTSAPAELIVFEDAATLAKLKDGSFDPASDAVTMEPGKATTRASGAVIITGPGETAASGQKFNYRSGSFEMPAVGKTVTLETSFAVDSGTPPLKSGDDVWLPGIGSMTVMETRAGNRENPATVELRNNGDPRNLAAGSAGWLGGDILGPGVAFEWDRPHTLGVRFDSADGNFATFSYYLDGAYVGSWMLRVGNRTLDRIGMFCHAHTDGAAFAFWNLRVYGEKS